MSNQIAMRKEHDWNAAIRAFLSRNYSPEKALALTSQLDEFPRSPEANYLIDAISELLNGGRVANLAIFDGIWTHSSRRFLLDTRGVGSRPQLASVL